MTGLLKPYAGSHPIEQGFDGHNSFEPKGDLSSNLLKARKVFDATKPPLTGYTRYNHLHMAQDVAMPIGNDLVAPAPCRLVLAGTYTSTGEHYAMLRLHKCPIHQTILFVTHLAAGGMVVPVGQLLKPLQHYAESGNSGMSTGPHLHWEIRVGSPGADPHLSAQWFKYDPAACLVGGKLAAQEFLTPIGI